MELIVVVVVFLILAAVLGPARKSRYERDMLEAFPRDRWTVYPSMENSGKWGIYRGGSMYCDFDTKAEAREKADSLY